ncbi:MAG: hypothetical protein RLZ40_214, partial [Actinomycetota bacterium]
MTHIDDQGRPEPPIAANEVDTLLGYLDFQRATLEWKTRGLGADGLRRTIASSSMTLAGLLKHMAYVEDHWFSGMLLEAIVRRRPSAPRPRVFHSSVARWKSRYPSNVSTS